MTKKDKTTSGLCPWTFVIDSDFVIRPWSFPIMSTPTDLDVAYVARLARLDLSAEETALFQASSRGFSSTRPGCARSMSRASNRPPTLFRPSTYCVRMKCAPGYAGGSAAQRARAANDLFIVPKVVE